MNDTHFRLYKKLLYFYKRYPRSLDTSMGALQGLFFRAHKVLSDRSYFDTVMTHVGIRPKRGIDDYASELKNNALLKRTYCQAIAEGRIPQKYKTYDDRIGTRVANLVNYYALVREMQPNIVVETGTASGSMTSWILAALEANGRGKLISIDIPPKDGRLTMDMTISKSEVGFLIPPEYHGRWQYICGDAKVLLPSILANNNVDLFVHDSLHTATHMLLEYNLARALMRPGTVIMSDDVLYWNDAWFHFLASHRLRGLGCISNTNLGLVVNSFSKYELDIGVGIVNL